MRYEYQLDVSGAYIPIRYSTWWAQTFTPQVSHNLVKVYLAFQRQNATLGPVTVSIRATDGGFPSGDDLVVNTTDGDTLPIFGAGYEWRKIPLALSLTALTMYAIVVRHLENTSIRLYWGTDYPQKLYAGGSLVGSSDGGNNWTDNEDRDAGFQECGYEIEPYGSPLPAFRRN